MMTGIMKKIIFHWIALVLLPVAVLAAPEELQQNKGPIEVTADRLEVDDMAQTLVFSGHAVATQDDVTINSDRMTVVYAGEKREVEKVIAQGHVRIVQKGRVASGDKATYFRKDGRVVLLGSPKVSTGDNFVQGQEITIYLDDQRSVVTGGDGGRVNAVFTPRKEAKP